MKKILQLLSIFLPSKIRIPFLNCLGHTISRDAKLGFGSILLSKNILMEAGARIDIFTFIVGLNTLNLKRLSSISRFTYISGNRSLYLDERSFIGSRCIINTTSGDVSFGKYSALAPRSSIYTHGTFLPVAHGYSRKNKGVSIGNFCWIMQNTSIGPGVNIGSNIIILPGSVVVKGIMDNSVIYDTPVDRKTFPMSIFKKELTDTELHNLITEITKSFLTDLKAKKRIIDFIESESSFKVNFTRKKVGFIHIKRPSNEVIEKCNAEYINCFFWYKINKNEMKSTSCFVLDFFELTHSNIRPPSSLKNFNNYMFYEYGLKFISV